MALEGNAGSGNAGPGAPRFTIGIVVSTSLRVIGANVFRFLGIVLAIGLPSVALIAVAILVMAEGSPTAGNAMVNFQLKGGPGGQVLFFAIVAVVALVFYVLTQTAITYGTFQTLRGRKPTVRACIANAVAAAPRVAVAGLILGLVLGVISVVAVQIFRLVAMGGDPVIGIVASVAFAAAIIFVLVLAWVFVPAIVVERKGPVDCFARSMDLTKGRRWAIFAIFLMVMLANWVVSFLSLALPRIGAPAAGAALNLASGLFFMALGAVLAAVGYYVLRAEKEGVLIDDVVKVFD